MSCASGGVEGPEEDPGVRMRSMRIGTTSNTLRSAQVRRISWVRGVGRLAVVGVASLKPSSVGRLPPPPTRRPHQASKGLSKTQLLVVLEEARRRAA